MYKGTKNKFFHIVYKICKEKNINFLDFHIEDITDLQKNIINLFKKRNKINDIKEFLDFYKYMDLKEQNLLIVDKKQNISYLDQIAIKKENIYGGFVYIDKKNFYLYDRSYLSAIKNIGVKLKKKEVFYD